MTRRRSPFVLFAAAAGPDLGFGHLVRCGVLADVLGVRREIALRGSSAAIHAAVRLGWSVHRGPGLVDALLPDLVVVDEPSRAHRERWMRLSHAARVPVATIVDGAVESIDADLIVDGSFMARPDNRRHRLAGPAWSVLAPHVRQRREEPVVRDPNRVLIALGGGAHVRGLGVAIARELTHALVGLPMPVQIDLACGFVHTEPVRLPPGCRWVHAPAGLTEHLAAAGVAVVGGGVTLYEACALGTAIVAVPVVEAQRPAIDAAVAVGAVRGIAHATPQAVARAVRLLLETPSIGAVHAAAAARLVDGGGTARVADRLRDLIDAPRLRGVRHAA